MATDPGKIEVVRSWPRPVSVKQLRVFFGLTGYYRRFIRKYGVLARPLTDLLRKEAFHWSEIAVQVFKS